MVLLLCLVAVAAFLTISSVTLGNNVDLGSDNVSIAVTGDVMFGRKMPGVLSSGESPFRYVENVTKAADVLLVNFENPATTTSSSSWRQQDSCRITGKQPCAGLRRRGNERQLEEFK